MGDQLLWVHAVQLGSEDRRKNPTYEKSARGSEPGRVFGRFSCAPPPSTGAETCVLLL